MRFLRYRQSRVQGREIGAINPFKSEMFRSHHKVCISPPCSKPFPCDTSLSSATPRRRRRWKTFLSLDHQGTSYSCLQRKGPLSCPWCICNNCNWAAWSQCWHWLTRRCRSRWCSPRHGSSSWCWGRSETGSWRIFQTKHISVNIWLYTISAELTRLLQKVLYLS